MGRKNFKTQEVPNKYSETFIEGIDQRLGVVKELRHRLNTLMVDLGGTEVLSYQQKSLCRRAIFVETMLEQVEKKLAHGETEGNLAVYAQGLNSLIGLYRALGYERKSKEVRLADIIAEHTEGQP